MDFNFKIEPNEEVCFNLYGGIAVGKFERNSSEFNFDLTTLDKKQTRYPEITYIEEGYNGIKNIRHFDVNCLAVLPISVAKKENLDYIDVYILLRLMQGHSAIQNMNSTLKDLCDSLHIFNFDKEILKSKKKKEFNNELKNRIYKAIITMKPFVDSFKDRCPDNHYEEFIKYYNSVIES